MDVVPMKNIVIGGRDTNEKYRSLSNFLENFRQIALFVLSCKKIKFLRDICDFNSYISYGVICARWRKMSNFLGFPRKIVLFVLNCKNLKILRDFCDFGSYISYGGSLRAERPAREGFAVAKENHHPRSSSFHSRSISASRVCCPSVR